MAQGKKKRKIKDTKINTKKEPIKKLEDRKEEPTTNSAKKKEKEIVSEKMPKEKKESSASKKTTSNRGTKTTLPKEKKEIAKEEKNKLSETKSNHSKEIKKTSSKKRVEKERAEKKKSTVKKKTEEPKIVKTTTKKATEKEEQKKETKTLTETKQKKTENTNTKKKKTSVQKKKSEEQPRKKTTEKKKANNNKEAAKVKSAKEKKKAVSSKSKKVSQTPEKKFSKQQRKELEKKGIDFLLTIAKKIKQLAIQFFIFSKVQAKKGKQLLKKIIEVLKIGLGKLQKGIRQFYKYLKEKYKVHQEKRKKKKEEKYVKKVALKEQKENTKKILAYQKEQTIKSNEKTTKDKKEESKEKKKKRVPKTPIVLGGLLILYFVATTLPYGTREYVSGASGKIIDVPKLTKLKEECCNYKATFTTIRSIKSLEKEMEQLIASYQKLNCDNKSYVYNEKGDYTITEYSLKKGKIFNEITITYGKGNSCELDTTFKKLEFLPNSFSLEDAKKDGNYVVTKEKIYNPEAYTKFMEEVEKKNVNTLRIVKTNEEGDLLITDVEYLKEGKIKVTYDKTRDRNNKDNYIMAYKYDHIGIYKNKLYAYNGSALNNDVIKSKNAYYLIDIPKEK